VTAGAEAAHGSPEELWNRSGYRCSIPWARGRGAWNRLVLQRFWRSWSIAKG